MNKLTLIGLCQLILTILTIASGCKAKKDNLVISQPNISMVSIAADDPLIRYTGRIDFGNTKAPVYSFPGVSIMAKFQGSAIDVIIKDYAAGGATTTNYYEIIIDGSVYKTLAVNNTDTLYPVAASLSDAEHIIEIFKRTESNVGKSSFKGFRLRAGKTLLALPAAPARKIEFIGDSFTCGYGDEVSITYPGGNPSTGFHSVNENNYSTWGATAARALNAQYVCTAYSGRGIYRNNTGSTTGTVPSFYNRIHPDDASAAWSTSNYIPDVVVIHLGTNDFAPEANTSPNMVDSTQFVNAYIGLVNTLRGIYPSAHIICVVPNSMSDGYPAGLKSYTRIKKYHSAIVNHFTSLSDNKVYYYELTPQSSPFGEDWHPSNVTQLSMANQITPFIKTKTGW